MANRIPLRDLERLTVRAGLVLVSLHSCAQLVAPSTALAEGFAVIRVATGLEQPVYVTAPPGDNSRLFLVEANSGGSTSGPTIAQIKILNLTGPDAGTINETPFLTVAGIRQMEDQGLFTLAFHPNYAQNGYFYVNHTTSDGSASVIERYQVSAADPNLADDASRTTILTVPKPFLNHNGDWFDFSPSDASHGLYYLYYTIGDGGAGGDPGDRAQNLSLRNGKLLRIDVGSDGLADDFPTDPLENYAIPASNPFVDTPSADPAIWASGFRNPWRASFDRRTGDLYIGDVGEVRAEEVNFQPFDSSGGENYGWSRLEGTLAGTNPTPTLTSSVVPIYEHRHGLAPTSGPGRAVTGGYVYRGPVTKLQGQYIFADFLGDYDYATQTGRAQIFSFRFDGSDPADFDGSNIIDDQVVNRTAEFQPNVGTIDFISSFGEDARGNLYIVDMGNLGTPDGLGLGEVYMIVPKFVSADADFDQNDVVNAADLAIWRTGFGATYAMHVQGDADGDFDVDGADFLLWQRQLGSTAPDDSANIPIPEPATPLMLVMGMVAIFCRTRITASSSRTFYYGASDNTSVGEAKHFIKHCLITRPSISVV
jgi:glucose/arabinose dehydrogenase